MLYKVSAFSALLSLFSVALVKAAEFQVTVGGPGGVIQYNPPFVTANPGDIVTFVFKQKNHTATQSTFADPCTPVPGGFDSGFIPVPDSNVNGPFQEAQFQVTDTNPVWVFCRQANHCQRGMVFAINPGDKFSAFQAAAMGNTTTQTSATPTTSVATSSTSLAVSSVTPPVATSTPSSSSQDHKIIVGGTGILTFQPANITAQPGDTITFEFHQKNHTITQSSFAAPCQMLASTSTSGQVGFDSGFMPVATDATTFPTFTIQVNDTAPIWAYCRQAGHCGQGMVFAANAIESGPNNFEAFEARAKQINGTSSNSTSSTTGKGNGAGAVRLSGTSITLGFVAALFGFMVV
ncbi:Cupredoxin [Multifurca ochricompacta]|uniref:Cupredoxin n=1 Tax=Multifurca ochricompacta TaxID=376703 RepID=A0AAD4QPN7_9AGAM|nr:Cupredoxin [Multifurca ochricompacta]